MGVAFFVVAFLVPVAVFFAAGLFLAGGDFLAGADFDDDGVRRVVTRSGSRQMCSRLAGREARCSALSPVTSESASA